MGGQAVQTGIPCPSSTVAVHWLKKGVIRIELPLPTQPAESGALRSRLALFALSPSISISSSRPLLLEPLCSAPRPAHIPDPIISIITASRRALAAFVSVARVAAILNIVASVCSRSSTDPPPRRPLWDLWSIVCWSKVVAIFSTSPALILCPRP
jgi:hypothetical protein